MGIRLKFIYFLFGVISLLSQVILIRRLLSIFYGNELTIGALFAGWMFWSGIGGLAFSKASDRAKNPEQASALIFFLCSIFFLISGLGSWLGRYILGLGPGVMAGLDKILIAGFLFSAPVCIILGGLFNYLARTKEAKNFKELGALPKLYLYEALGSGLGGILSLLMVGKISPLAQIFLCGLLMMLGGSLAIMGNRLKVVALSASFLLFGLLMVFSGRVENFLVKARWQNQELVLERESKYSTISITKSEEQTNFWLDGFLAFSYPDPEHFEYITHLGLSMVEKPRRVLLIGGGLVGSAEEIFKHPVEELVYVQIDPMLTELEASYLEGFNRLKADRRIKIIHQDARIFLKHSEDKFDAIIINLPTPETANLNRYYTKEFYELAKRHLEPNGVLSLSLGSTGNYLSDAQASLLANGLLTISAVFAKISVLPLEQNYLVASEKSPLMTEDPELILSHLENRGVKTKFVRDYYLKDNLSTERLASVEKRLKGFIKQLTNTDLNPRAYYLSILLWLEQANPDLRTVVNEILNVKKSGFYWGLLGLFLIWLLVNFLKKKPGFALISIFSLGLVGIGVEMVLLVGFQVGYGYVYYLLGLLTSGFMVGLCLGAYFYEHCKEKLERKVFGVLVLVLAGESGSIFLSWLILKVILNYFPGEVLTVILFLVALIFVAIFSGLGFLLSAELLKKETGAGLGAVSGWVNGMDHFGSCLGAFLVSVFLIPLFGLEFGLSFLGLLMIVGIISSIWLVK